MSTLVAGHICLDLIPRLRGHPSIRPGDLVEVGPMTVRAGGCVANTASGLRELGWPVRIAADVGTDALGDILLRVLADRGLPTGDIRRTDQSTSYSVVVQPPGEDRTFWHHVGANRHFDGTSVELAGCDLLHVGYPSILPALVADDGRALVRLLDRARRTGATTSVDLAVVDHTAAPGSPDDSGPAAVYDTWRAVLRAALPGTDVISPSLDDVTSATGWPAAPEPDTVVGVAERLVGYGAAVAMVTAGAQGIALATGPAERLRDAGRVGSRLSSAWAGVRCWHPVEPVPDPVGTTGAGDAATAGLLCALREGLDPDAAVALAAGAGRHRIQGRSLASLRTAG